jgi:hypothetical protein
MIPLFIGLSAANLLLLLAVFGLGFFAVDSAHHATALYTYHISLGIAAGLMATLTHLAFYTYFMATSRGLVAATDKANLPRERYAIPAFTGKRRALPVAMAAVMLTMLAMFAGAGADSTMRPWWPTEVHLTAAGIALAANALGAAVELAMIRAQGRLMDGALAELNQRPGVSVER